MVDNIVPIVDKAVRMVDNKLPFPDWRVGNRMSSVCTGRGKTPVLKGHDFILPIRPIEWMGL